MTGGRSGEAQRNWDTGLVHPLCLKKSNCDEGRQKASHPTL